MRDTSVCLFRVRIEPVDWTKWLRQKKVEVIQGLKSLRDQININYEGMEHEMNGNTWLLLEEEQPAYRCTQMYGLASGRLKVFQLEELF